VHVTLVPRDDEQYIPSIFGRRRVLRDVFPWNRQDRSGLTGYGLPRTFGRFSSCPATADAVHASRGAVITLERNGELQTRTVRGEGLRISTAVRDRVLEQKKSLLVRDMSADIELAGRHSILAQEIRSFIAVPLQTDEQVIGLIYLDSPRLIREFTTNDLNLVMVMANIAAIRIDHARLMKAEPPRMLLTRDLDRAAEIQRRLLPRKAAAYHRRGCGRIQRALPDCRWGLLRLSAVRR
jgi:GAF domain-containing protein